MGASSPKKSSLHRGLASRHAQMMSISSAIGVGLFMGSGKVISMAGPSIILVYMIIGFFIFFFMRAMGELLLSNLHYKSFVDFSADLLGPRVGFFTGWSYWFFLVVTVIAQIAAVAGYMQFWFPALPEWIPAFITVMVLLSLNLAEVRFFGEAEFWFVLIKVLAICALIILGVVLLVMGFRSPSTGAVTSLNNLWNHGGIFPKGLMGFFAGFQMAIFAFTGVELVGTAAAETVDPTKTVPHAFNAIALRVVFFYALCLIVIMCVTPWDTIAPDKSPFVEMFMLVGLPAAAGIVNFVVLTSAASASNSNIFSMGRVLYGLAQKREAPSIFGVLSKEDVPTRGLFFSCICLLSGVLVIYLIPNVMRIFILFTTMSSILCMTVWGIIIYAYLVYRQKYPDLHQQSVYKMPAGIVMSWLCIIFFIFVAILLTLEADTREALAVTLILFVAMAVAYEWLTWYQRRQQSKQLKR